MGADHDEHGCVWESATLTKSAACATVHGRKIVLVVCDDMRADHGPFLDESDPFYGVTPNLNRLGERAVSFSRAYASYPLCSPSRLSFLTGRTLDSLRASPPVDSSTVAPPTMKYMVNFMY